MWLFDGSWLKAFLITNVAMIPFALVNLAIGGNANYWFIAAKPGGDSPLIFGEWHFYILGFEVLGLLSFRLLHLRMWGSNPPVPEGPQAHRPMPRPDAALTLPL